MTRREMEKKPIWVPRYYEPRFGQEVEVRYDEEFWYQVAPEMNLFRRYFDLIDLNGLADARLCDLGCGMGRWSFFASRYCREIVLVDFSEAIFVAREVMRERRNAIFVMADVRPCRSPRTSPI